ncbi:uncharacterized [Tachysurus ichikawai]
MPEHDSYLLGSAHQCPYILKAHCSQGLGDSITPAPDLFPKSSHIKDPQCLHSIRSQSDPPRKGLNKMKNGKNPQSENIKASSLEVFAAFLLLATPFLAFSAPTFPAPS